ncbi:MAG TPA: D-aminoacyl-tRNA deacylase [Steroidobacteraceae bacterium]
MIALIQRVTRAEVTVGEASVARIERGILAFIGVRKGDTEVAADRLLERIVGYRIFSDDAGRMNLSLKDVGGDLLLVSQFTLAADTRSGMRAGFSTAAAPDEGRRLFDHLVDAARASLPRVATGEFGAHMQVSLVNDGPVTFWLETPATSP